MPYYTEPGQAGSEEHPYHSHPHDASMPFAPIIATLAGVIAWLIFILIFALDWSKSYSLFQNIVVFIVSLAVTAIAISMMWLIWGRNRWYWWRGQYWE